MKPARQVIETAVRDVIQRSLQVIKLIVIELRKKSERERELSKTMSLLSNREIVEKS